MKGIILAAGYATRLYPLTKNQPKALLPVHGRPMLDYIVSEMLTLESLDDITVISNHRFAEQFRQWAAERPDWPLVILDDGTKHEDDRLGALGDLALAIEEREIDDDILVIASDNLFTYRLADAYQEFRRTRRDTILATKLTSDEDLRQFATVIIDDQGRAVQIVEKDPNPKSDIAVFATYFYRRDTLPLLRLYLQDGNPPDAPGHFPEWLCRRRDVQVYLFDGVCLDVGTPQSYRDVMSTFPLSVADAQIEAGRQAVERRQRAP